MTHERFHHASATTSCTQCSVFANKSHIQSHIELYSLPIRFVAAEAGFFPLGPWTDFADMLYGVGVYLHEKNGYDCAKQNPNALQNLKT